MLTTPLYSSDLNASLTLHTPQHLSDVSCLCRGNPNRPRSLKTRQIQEKSRDGREPIGQRLARSLLQGHLRMSTFSQPPFALPFTCCRVSVGAEALRGTLGNVRDTSTQARTFGEHNDAPQSAGGRKNKHRSIPGLHTGFHSIFLTELMLITSARGSNNHPPISGAPFVLLI